PPPAPAPPPPVAPPSAEAPRKSKSKGPYICSLCAKEFKNGYNLRRHEAIHTGAKAARPGAAAAAAMKMPTMVPLSLLSVSGLGGGGAEG
ncbi:MAZ protein, partial [Haliaeetus albicilla]|nr:MAZ protein [Haliaeetus albicilla]